MCVQYVKLIVGRQAGFRTSALCQSQINRSNGNSHRFSYKLSPCIATAIEQKAAQLRPTLDCPNQSGKPSFRRFSAMRFRTAGEKTIACLNFEIVRSGYLRINSAKACLASSTRPAPDRDDAKLR